MHTTGVIFSARFCSVSVLFPHLTFASVLPHSAYHKETASPIFRRVIGACTVTVHVFWICLKSGLELRKEQWNIRWLREIYYCNVSPHWMIFKTTCASSFFRRRFGGMQIILGFSSISLQGTVGVPHEPPFCYHRGIKVVQQGGGLFVVWKIRWDSNFKRVKEASSVVPTTY